MSPWIKCSDLKPSEGAPLLLYTENYGQMVMALGTYARDQYFSQGHREYPTHWMPLPQPPTD